MTRILWWMVEVLSRTLTPDERAAVRGDLAERGSTGAQALRDVLGLVARRQAELWKGWRPWVAVLALAVPLSVPLTLYARHNADNGAVYLWMYVNNWDPSLLRIGAFRHDAAAYIGLVLWQYVTLACWSWNIGVALGWISRRAIPVTGILFCLMLEAELWSTPLVTLLGRPIGFARDFSPNAAAFRVAFYRLAFPAIVQAVAVLLPAIDGMRRGVRWTALGPRAAMLLRISAMVNAISILSLFWFPWLLHHAHGRPDFWNGPIRLVQLLLVFVHWPIGYLAVKTIARLRRGKTIRTAALLAALAGIAAAADPATVRAPLQPAADRKPATEIALKDSTGKTATLKQYRGKVVLLDFWATWCHGCKEEIPWFADFQRKYGRKGLRVVGVSLDDGGWKVVLPFLQSARLPYRIILGDDATAKTYGIDAMPDTFLIDRQGRVAAAYTGVVDKDNVEANLRAILGER